MEDVHAREDSAGAPLGFKQNPEEHVVLVEQMVLFSTQDPSEQERQAVTPGLDTGTATKRSAKMAEIPDAAV